MSYIEKTLTDNEKIIAFRRSHWISLFWPVVLFTFFISISSFLLYLFRNLPADFVDFYEGIKITIFIIIALFLIFIVTTIFTYLIKYISTEYVITNKRIIFKTGFIWTNTDELRNSQLENIQIKQSIMGRILLYGDLEFRGTGGSPVIFRTISHPITFKKKIENHLYK